MKRPRLWGSILLLAAVAIAAGDAPKTLREGERTEIDWQRGMIRVRGIAPPQTNADAANQQFRQKRVAEVDAMRLALETIEGVQVTSETTV